MVLLILDLHHLSEKLVDLLFAVSCVSTLYVLNRLTLESASWVAELEGPEELVGLLEVFATGVNFVNEVLNTNNSVTPQLLFNDLVAGEWGTTTVYAAKSTLVNQFLNGLEIRIP